MPRYRNPESERNIRRIDSITVHGFQFHAQRFDLKITRLFSDTVSGGKLAAIERARHFRDNTVPNLPKPTNSWGPRKHATHSNTGFMGISFTESVNADGTTRIYIQSTARYPSSKKSINKKIRMESDADISEIIQQLRDWRESVLAGSEQ